MTLLKPTLRLNRLCIECRGGAAYDERFHEGINIIRGENSSGKSTIINAIFYGLGGDVTRWSEAAAHCQRVTLEVGLNDKVATLSREISAQQRQPMEIFGGGMEDSKVAPRSEWLRYPYLRSASKESFSQALFRILEIPEASNEQSGNITMHQLLRLMYSDQLSAVDNIFRQEPFDSANLRDSVGRLLCGAFDNELYSNELRIRELDKLFDQKAAELRSLVAVLGRSEHNLTTEWLAAERMSLTQERVVLLGQIDEAQREVMSNPSGPSLDEQQRAYTSLTTLQANLSEARDERDRLLLEVADSAAFIESLEQKLEALRDANLTAAEIGDVRFSHCPSCHAPIGEAASGDVCHLCKAPFDGDRSQRRLVAIINDTSIQLKQSRTLQEERQGQLSGLSAEVDRFTRVFTEQALEYGRLRRNPVDAGQAKLNDLQRRLGYLDRQIEELASRGRLIEQVEKLAAEKDQINDDLSRYRSRNEILKANEQSRLGKAYEDISEGTRWFISHDLRREEGFEAPRRVDFDFAKDRIIVDDQDYFSASSRVVLKNSFMAAFLFAATQNAFFRHFRFLLMDTIEDKGMEPNRSQNFQNLLLEKSRAAPADHQIIFATSMISSELDEEEFTIGEFSTRDNPTLKLGALPINS